MEEPQRHTEAVNTGASLLIKAALIFWLLFLYIAVMWFWDSQNIITKISGASALLLSFISLFMPANDKHLKLLVYFVVATSVLFYVSQWL